jgi:fermentation-respiration switch protein FrsA (DUF1100 family)
MKMIVFAAVCGCVAVLLYYYTAQGRLIYHPSGLLRSTPADHGYAYEDIALVTADAVRLHAWYIPHPQAHGSVLFLHGNAGNIADRPLTLARLHEFGFNVLMLDYRGYGRSEGKPSELGTYADARAAWDFLTAQRNIAPRDIIVYGRSLGGAVALELATSTAPRAVVVESTFTSLTAMARELYPYLPGSLLLKFKYPSIDYVKRLTAPVLVAHSEDDELIPFAHGLALYEQAVQPKHFYRMTGTHNDAFVRSGTAYYAVLADFMRGREPIDAGMVP